MLRRHLHGAGSRRMLQGHPRPREPGPCRPLSLRHDGAGRLDAYDLVPDPDEDVEFDCTVNSVTYYGGRHRTVPGNGPPGEMGDRLESLHRRNG